ncbi:flagellar filament capping protein FliD [Desulfohalobium retbaense]|uniref:Flagellar hook-associated protein 2 n=1 Tax=Desulfohalobium retbaense (strain ATCC 49708 / DSM 5692 / JCM 16813 / HR100) TaxID=485915 RepID=C8WZ11_DESRD|nr:flagellar filament capping protein FliD [Desulfohalobium retbaense]ACV67927.1 flagellar hook-associated 2 domain protein [Desulfohalobium retbaense DSM 5692]
MALGSVSGVYLGGRPSGLPDNLVEQLVSARQQQKITPINQDINEVDDRISLFQSLESKVASLEDTLGDLQDSSDFEEAKVSSSNDQALSVAQNGAPQSGSYTVEVDTLAQADVQLVGLDDGTTTGVDTGIADTTDASLVEDVTFEFDHNGSTHSFDTTGKSLQALADEINASDAGVQAYTANIGTQDDPEYALSLKSDTPGGGVDDLISNISGNLFGTSTTTENSMAGQDAAFSVDGVSYTRSSNTIEDVIPGVSMTLNENFAGQVSVGVEKDTEAIEKKVSAFVSAFNDVRSFISSKSSYSEDDDTAGGLLGSSLAGRLEMSMANLAIDSFAALSGNTYDRLPEIGVELQRDGTLALDSAKFQEAMETNGQDVASLFTEDGGVADKMQSLLGGYTDSIDGSLTYKLESLNNQMSRLEDDKQDAYNSIESYRDRLVDKYTAMETQIRQYQQMQESITSLTLSFNKDG